jgi:AcrR family transcriptional regulator
MKKRSVGRPRDGNPDETRREILKAAEESFAAAGFTGATTREVAARAGVNVATLHYHFGNKEGLYRAVIDRAVAGEIPVPDSPGPPAERLGRAVGALFDFAAERPALPRLSLFDRLAGPAPSASVRTEGEAEEPRVAALRRVLVSVATDGPTNGLPPGLASRVIVTLIDGSLLATAESGAAAPRNGHRARSRDAVIAAALKVAGF